MNLRKKWNDAWYKKINFMMNTKTNFWRKNRKNLTTNLEFITLLRYKFFWRDMNECGNCFSPTFLLAHSCEMLPEKGHYRKKIIVNQIDDRHVWAKTEGIGMIREKSRNVHVNFRGYTARINGIMTRKELTYRILRERGDREMAEHWYRHITGNRKENGKGNGKGNGKEKREG